MSATVYRITTMLSSVLRPVPLGTNLGLFHLLWTLLSGRLLASRGAIIPALADTGLAAPAVRRAWAALAGGHWEINACSPAGSGGSKATGAGNPAPTGATAPSPVTWSGSGVRACKRVPPSTTLPRRARRCRLFPSA